MHRTRAFHAAAVAGCFVLAASTTPRAMQSQTFEGAISIRVTTNGRNGPASQELEYLTRAGNVRVNMASPGGPVAILYLIDDRKTYMMMESQKAYMEVPVRDLAAAATAKSADAKVTRSGRRETIAGHECEHVMVETTTASGTQRTDVCAAQDLGGFMNPMAAIGGGLAPSWQRLTAEAGFPLRVTMPDGTVALDVTKIEKRRVRDDLFRIPAEFGKMDMPKRPPA